MTNKKTNVSEFQAMHHEAGLIAKGMGNYANRDNDLGDRVTAIYKSETKQGEYLAWLSEHMQINDTDNAKAETKRVQRVIANANTQRKMQGLDKKAELESKVRLMRANKPLLEKKLCTAEQVKSKTYMFIVESKPKADFKKSLENLMTKFNVDKEKAQSILATIKE
ncbi:MAG: hypothetical protein S4CHLAM27_12770 [Chlamydiia bacterium]|nr:hypothetical protein [Chlamydiia bacterium]